MTKHLKTATSPASIVTYLSSRTEQFNDNDNDNLEPRCPFRYLTIFNNLQSKKLQFISFILFFFIFSLPNFKRTCICAYKVAAPLQLRIKPMHGRSQEFSKGGGGHTGSNNIVMAFSPRNIVGYLLKKSSYKGGVTGTPGPPSLRPCYVTKKVKCISSVHLQQGSFWFFDDFIKCGEVKLVQSLILFNSVAILRNEVWSILPPEIYCYVATIWANLVKPKTIKNSYKMLLRNF